MIDVKEGDIVTRYMGGDVVFMQMRVVKVIEDLIYCQAIGKGGQPSPISDDQLEELWKFDRLTGVEEDHELGWGRKLGVTGTYIKQPPPPPSVDPVPPSPTRE